MTAGKIRIVTAFWFSATGTTRKVCETVARAAADALGAEYASRSFNAPESRKQEYRFGPDELVVFGLPTYAGRIPNLILPFVRDCVRGERTPAVPVVLYGNRDFDDALIELRDVLAGNGFVPIAAGAFVGEHAFSRTLGAGRPDAEDLREAEGLAALAVKRIRVSEKEGLPERPVEVAGCEPVRPYYTPRDRFGGPIDIRKVKPKTDPERCVRCGLCASVCPMGSIDPEDVSAVTGVCIKCCACVKRCPAGAKYFDDEGWLYHRSELEALYGDKRAENRCF
ncbi:MAG: 4Fe-4S binding protein [Lachnospiraceae bacterium]|nr:4Fe-4S binding protein [Lachnospiraceae bacterium]